MFREPTLFLRLLLALALGLAPVAVLSAQAGGAPVEGFADSASGTHAAMAMPVDADGVAPACNDCTDTCCEAGVCAATACGVCVTALPSATTSLSWDGLHVGAPTESGARPTLLPDLRFRPPRA